MKEGTSLELVVFMLIIFLSPLLSKGEDFKIQIRSHAHAVGRQSTASAVLPQPTLSSMSIKKASERMNWLESFTRLHQTGGSGFCSGLTFDNDITMIHFTMLFSLCKIY